MKKFTKIYKAFSLIILIYFIMMYVNMVINSPGNNIYENIIMGFFFLITYLAIFIPYLMYYIFINKGIRESRKDNLSEIDFSKDKNYYRDIIKNYNPAVLSYIDDFKNIEEKDIISLLMSLQLKRKIIMEEKGISIIDNDYSDLSESEICVLNSISKGKVNIRSFEIKNSVIKDCFKKDLIRKEDIYVIGKRICRKIISIIVWIIFCFYLSDFLFESEKEIFAILGSIIMIINIICIQGYFIYIFSYAVHQFVSYVRTPKGEEINVKLEGLKVFLKDFGNMKDKDSNELMLWEDYVIYSVLFRINKDAINKYSKYINLQ